MQSLETWIEVFALVDAAAQHHETARRLEPLAASCDSNGKAGLASRARVQRRLGDAADER
jgi:hypothetical protein